VAADSFVKYTLILPQNIAMAKKLNKNGGITVKNKYFYYCTHKMFWPRQAVR
jgi:hypothetical protein